MTSEIFQLRNMTWLKKTLKWGTQFHSACNLQSQLASYQQGKHTRVIFMSIIFSTQHCSKGWKGNDTANCVKSMKLGTFVSFKNLIQNFEGATILDHVIDDVSSLYEWNVLTAKQVILYIAGK